MAKKNHHLQLEMTGKFAIHTLDNLIIVHHQANQVSMIFDIQVGGIHDGYLTNHHPILPRQQISVPDSISTDPDSAYERSLELCEFWSIFIQLDSYGSANY